MDETRWQHIHELFSQAVGLPAEMRAAFLHDACAGDEELLAEVMKMIDHDVGNELSTIGMPPETVSRAIEESNDSYPAVELGTQLDKYTVTEKLGEGGMGFVFRAEQVFPEREVALKVVRHQVDGQSTRRLGRRLRQEANLLSRLVHPGVARIYDAGSIAVGDGAYPFIAMELVEGKILRNFVAETQLQVEDRLRLFVAICEAIEHAHQKGVIHRDIKPENILVTKEGQPKVVDFGIARTTDGDWETTQVDVDVHRIRGTLAYMSPEQASGPVGDIDTRSDVYSLGVVLYELLSGEVPHRLTGLMVFEAVRVIREESPSRISVLNSALRGDIETIVQKAIQKDRDRRYPSVSELRADVQRFLDNQPIMAQRPSTVYELRKFVSRHRGATALGMIATLALSIGLAFALHFATLASRRERDLAESQLQARQSAMAAEERGRQLQRVQYKENIARSWNAYQQGDLPTMSEKLFACDERQRGWEWNYLIGLSSISRADHVIHSRGPDPILAVAHNSGVDSFAVIRRSGMLQVWDTSTGALVNEVGLLSHLGNGVGNLGQFVDGVTHVDADVSPSGEFIAVSLGDVVRVLNMPSLSEVYSIATSCSVVRFLKPRDQLLCSDATNGTTVYRHKDAQLIKRFPDFITEDVGADRRRAYGCERPLSAHGASFFGHTATKSWSVLNTVQSRLDPLVETDGGFHLTAVSAGGRDFVFHSANGIHIYNNLAEYWGVLKTRHHDAKADFWGSLLFVMSAEQGSVEAWDIRPGGDGYEFRLLSILGCEDIEPSCMSVDGRSTVVACGRDGSLKIWRHAVNKAPFPRALDGVGVDQVTTKVVLSPEGRRCVVLNEIEESTFGKPWLRNCTFLDTTRLLPGIRVHQPGSKYPEVYFAHDAAFASPGYAVIADDTGLTMWNTRWAYLVGTKNVYSKSIAIDQQGGRLYCATDCQDVLVFESFDGPLIETIETPGFYASLIGVAEFGKHFFVLGRLDATGWEARLFSKESFVQTDRIKLPWERKASAAIDSYGRMFAVVPSEYSVSGYRSYFPIHVYRIDGERADEIVLGGHIAPVTSLEFVDDGARLVSADRAGRISIWDPSTGEELLRMNGEPVNDLAVGQNGSVMLVGTTTGLVAW